MATIFDCSDDASLLTGMRLARAAIGRGELVVIPTDTVYGLAANAFDPAAVQKLLDAKGRSRQAPPPVLIPGIPTLDALTEEVPPEVRTLVAKFWPGGLTVILPARSSLRWDLGETGGTVALRMPSDRIALELLSETGPLAVSSANLSGETAANTAVEAERMLGDSVAVYLDGGTTGDTSADGPPVGTGSTIVDATGLLTDGGMLRIVREGVISASEIFAVLADGHPENFNLFGQIAPTATVTAVEAIPAAEPGRRGEPVARTESTDSAPESPPAESAAQ